MLKKIIKNYTPTLKALDTVEEQARAIQDLYDQTREFYRWINSSEFKSLLKGDKGEKGDRGERGLPGIKGADGARGEVGLTGDKGEKGEKGDTGERGLQGIAGAQGEKGEKGERGLQGEKGDIGLTGPRGPKGDKGDIGEWLGIVEVYPTYVDMVRLETNPVDAGFYLIAEDNAERGDVYVYNALLGKYVFINNLVYDLMFQIIQGPAGRNYLTLTEGEHINEYGTASVEEGQVYRDNRGYMHTEFILNYLKGNGIVNKEWTPNDQDSGTSVLKLTFADGEVITVNIKNGKGIRGINKTNTEVLVDTYTITYSDNTTETFDVSNGRGITKIEKTSTDVLTDNYTITYNDGTTNTYTVVNGKGIARIEKTGTNVLVDTYTIYWNDNTTTTYDVTNGKGIISVTKTATDVLIDTYTIKFNDGTNTTYQVTNGKGIISIAFLNRDVLVDTYRIIFNDESYIDYTVTNGRGIVSVIKTETVGLIDTYTITYNDNTTSNFNVTNGRQKFLMEELYVGTGSVYTDVFLPSNKYENLESPNRFNITCNNNNIIVIYNDNNTYMIPPKMNGMDIPMTASTFTSDGKTYNVLISNNTYTGTFNIDI